MKPSELSRASEGKIVRRLYDKAESLEQHF